MASVFHITSERDWLAAQESGEYRLSTRGQALAADGFIHCSDAHQVTRIANAVYGDTDEPVVVLEVSTDDLDIDVRYENLDGGGELFLHVYGALPLGAVVAIHPLERDSAGEFRGTERGRVGE